MKPPKCRVCEHEHWGRDPHVFKAIADTFEALGRSPEEAKELEQVALVANSPVANKVANKDRHKKTDARRAYMRELMRKRRAA
jgi:hypothetical protein